MKKVKIEKTLGLKKETIVNLNIEGLANAKGGQLRKYTLIEECFTLKSYCGILICG